MSDALDRMIKGRVGLIAREPFFATLALSRLELVEDPKCETTWTDGRRLGFNPEHVLAADSMDQVEAIWAHHVATCALGHPFRRNGRDAKLWNEASDHCVNSYISKAGFKLPEGSLYDPRYDGMYVEQIYSMMQEQPQGDDSEQQQKQDPGDGASGDQSGSDQPGASPDSGDPTSGKAAGSDATGECRDATSEDGASEDQPASPAEMADQEQDWQTSVAQAEQSARAAGKLGGDTERMARSVLNPVVDWREALQRLLKARTKDDYSMRRPNRRYVPFGLYVGSLDSPRCGILAFAIDYSASIKQREVDQFCSEVEDARSTLNPEKVVVYIFDVGVRQTLEFGSGEPIELPPVTSQGGTSFVAPVLEANKLEVDPEVLVFLTDLDCNDFAPEPTYPVVWVTTRKTIAPYGDIISMY